MLYKFLTDKVEAPGGGGPRPLVVFFFLIWIFCIHRTSKIKSSLIPEAKPVQNMFFFMFYDPYHSCGIAAKDAAQTVCQSVEHPHILSEPKVTDTNLFTTTSGLQRDNEVMLKPHWFKVRWKYCEGKTAITMFSNGSLTCCHLNICENKSRPAGLSYSFVLI